MSIASWTRRVRSEGDTTGREVRDRAHDRRGRGWPPATVVTEMVVEEFPYGTGGNPVQLKATVPVRTCGDCGFQFTDHRAESARHEAVCRHLGVMTPVEVEGVRTRLGMTRAAFAEVTRLGEASLTRWEKAS